VPVEVPVKPTAAVSPAAPAAPAGLPNVPQWLNGATWIRIQPPDAFTLQLFGTHDSASVLKFVNANKLAIPVAWFRTIHQQRDWYVVIAGSYRNRVEAIEAIAKLPARLRKQGPWARDFKGIQAAMQP
jgi:DamX protein